MKIVKVEPISPAISMTWMIGSRCNYACSYCPAELHDDYSAHPELGQLKQAWDNFYAKTQHTGLPYKISFTGGEVTANKNFLPLIEFLREQKDIQLQIMVTTNGSASKRYYLRLAELVDAISFSTHSEFFNEQEFFDKVVLINQHMTRPAKSVHVNIMDEYWNQDRIKLYQQLLDTHSVSHSINAINYDVKIRDFPVQKGRLNLVRQ
jgi:MoaA/NifB/PqqE/SkfB family radical SAM enzyme